MFVLEHTCSMFSIISSGSKDISSSPPAWQEEWFDWWIHTHTIPNTGKFGSLTVYLCNRPIKTRQYFLLAYNYTYGAIPYQTAKFKSANIFSMAILGPTAKFNSRQYFRLYSKLNSTS